MGFHVSLICVSLESREGLLRGAGLIETGEPDAYNETPFSGVTHRGLYIVWQNWRDDMLDEADYARISAQGVDLLTCDLTEGPMFSACRAWSAGRVSWGVAHDGSHNLRSMEVTGDPPTAWPELLAEAMGRQDRDTGRVDHLFDAPIALFVSLGGLQYDADHDLPFVSLKRRPDSLSTSSAMAAAKPWWKLW